MQMMYSKTNCKTWIENIYNYTNPEDLAVLEKENFLVICVLHHF